MWKIIIVLEYSCKPLNNIGRHLVVQSGSHSYLTQNQFELVVLRSNIGVFSKLTQVGRHGVNGMVHNFPGLVAHCDSLSLHFILGLKCIAGIAM